MTTRAEQATKGLDVVADAGLVRVRDGADTWVVSESDYNAAYERLDALPAYDDAGGEGAVAAYDDLCQATARNVASINGTSRGDWRPLVSAALAAGLIEDAEPFGVES